MPSLSNTPTRSSNRAVQIGVLIMVVLGFIVGLLLLRSRQEIREQATNPSGTATLSLSPMQPVPNFPNTYKVDLFVNMGVSQVNIDGIQLVANLSGQIPADLSFTPATIPGLSIINASSVLTDDTNGKKLSLVYLTSSPTSPFVGNDQPLLLGSFNFTNATGSMIFTLNPTLSKVNQNQTGTDILLPLSPITINPAVCSLLVTINSSATPTPTPSNSPTASPTNTPTPTPSNTPTPTPTPGTGGNTPTPTPTHTPTPSNTPTASPSNTPTPTPTNTPRPITDLELQKTVNNTTPTVGQDVTFTIQVTNKGPNNATGVAVRDVLPTGVSYLSSTATRGSYSNSTNIWTIGNLNVNETVYLYITVRVNSAASITNIAEVYSNDLPDVDSTPNNNVTGEDDQDDVTLNSTTPKVACNQSCTYNSDCADASHICYGSPSTCRLASNPDSASCLAPTSSPTPVPQLPKAGGTGSSGLFIVVGIVVLLLGALAVLLLI